MQIRNSSLPQAPDIVPPPPEASVKAQWSKANEITHIEYIAEHKTKTGDGMKFKASFWTGAAKKMASHSALGGMKTAQGCSSKWDRVRNNLSQVTPPPMHIYPAQEVLQCCCYTQSQYIWIQLERHQGP